MHVKEVAAHYSMPGLTFGGFLMLISPMHSSTPVRIVNVERNGEGILVIFNDGRSYIYPLDLLLFMVIYAHEVEGLGSSANLARKPALAKVPAFYSVNEAQKPANKRVHHNDNTCATAGVIPYQERREGTGGYRLCENCQQR
jgi:hypothetical protein